MSRHELSPLPGLVDVTAVVIGWDRPLETFFLQVMGRRGGVRIWRGDRLRQLPTASSVIREASLYAAIPADLQARLQADQSDDAGPDGPALSALKQAGIVQ
jgi:hypothetical protein